MKYVWITARFVFVGLIVAATVVSMGFKHSVSNLGSLLGGQEATSSDQTADKAEDLVKHWEAESGKPDFVLFVTGRQKGYIEPCGCITLERQKGGLMRRHTVQKILKARGWETVSIDAGNQVRRVGNQPEIKLRRTFEALCSPQNMDYDVIGIGPDDLKLPAIELGQAMSNNSTPEKNPFTCANVQIFGDSTSNAFRIIERNNKKIGITMVLGDEHLDASQQQFVETIPMEKSLVPVVAQMEAAGCDLKVLVAFTKLEECRELGKKFPFDVLVTAGGAGDPTLHPEVIEGENHATSMIQVGVKGMYVGLVGFFSEGLAKPTIKYERVELDHRYEDSSEIKEVFKAYQAELKDRWLANTLDEIRPRKHPSGHTFVGSDTCNDCHDEEFEIWENGVDGDGGPHAEATKDLRKNPNDNRVWVQRHYDPECMSCHAVGWNPQKFFPYESGLLDVEKDTHLHENGCENCHGPGSAHVAIQQAVNDGKNVDEALRNRLQQEMVVTLKESRDGACKVCHDLDNSPDFLKEGGFDKYWPKIKHGGDDD